MNVRISGSYLEIAKELKTAAGAGRFRNQLDSFVCVAVSQKSGRSALVTLVVKIAAVKNFIGMR